MPHKPIVLIEFDFDSLDEALAKPLGTRIAAANAHTARLTAQGILFSETTLYRLTDGARVGSAAKTQKW